MSRDEQMPAAEADPRARKQRGRPFQPGQSGNPNGRPPGARNKAIAALDALGESNAEAVVQAVITTALKGDTRAAALLLERVWPARRGRPVSLALPAIRTAADVLEAMSALSGAVGSGALSPEEAQVVGALLEVQRRTLETAELEARLAALEAKLTSNGDPR